MTYLLIALTAGLLAYANGANDNFKGVATLLGSGTTSYRGALTWATVTTLAGSLAAVLLAEKLLKNFSGRGLVDAAIVADPRYVAAVAMGAGSTVLLATRIGMPVSTTHGLVGALVGAGWAAGSTIHVNQLSSNFLVPLLVSPVIAIAATSVLYLLLHAVRRMSGVTHETCICIGREVVDVVVAAPGSMAAAERVEQLSVAHGTNATCQRRYQGSMLGVDAAIVVDKLHFLTAGLVSFARGMNDTPKIAALLLLLPALGNGGSVGCVAVMIAIGGIVSAKRVAEVMSRQITPMNHGQGFTANLVTGVMVTGASWFGWPVSTTHVSCGALFGIGTITRQARWGTIAKIVTAWVTTLPTGAGLGALGYWVITRLG
jgi:PiT family inorganic phosphate transporter